MLSFKPQTDEELLNLLPDGVYKFKVIEAMSKTSQTNKQMIMLTLSTSYRNKEVKVKTVLMADLLYKVKHFCDSANISEKYESGMLASKDCIDRNVWAKVKTKRDEQYGIRNDITDFVVQPSPKASLVADPTLNDEILF